MGYKGDWQRPHNKEKFNDNYDKIFKKEEEKKEEGCPECKKKMTHRIDCSRIAIEGREVL